MVERLRGFLVGLNVRNKERAINMIDENQVIKEISERLYDIFVVNSGVIGIQMPDGKYIPRIINYNSSIFEKMIQKKMSLGIYQQQYNRNVTKWICLDFDCKNIDDKNLPDLVEYLVNPCIELLEQCDISYLLEFSGRRGIHIWVVFDTIISKSQAYKIVSNIKQRVLIKNEKMFEYAIDIFPKISGGINKYGSMVKCPLSFHKKGKQSFLMKNINEFITTTGFNFDVDLVKQLELLQKYKKNDYYTVCDKLSILQTNNELKIPLYKKQYLILEKHDFSYSFLDIEKKCSDSIVFKKLFQNIKGGCLSHLDRLILVSTFSYFNEDLLYSFFELQNNYSYQKTKEYIKKYTAKYYPITMKYMYDIYNEKMEDSINPEATTLEFICDRLNINKELIKNLEPSQESAYASLKLYNLIEKEISYMKYNDEVLDIVDFYKISNLKKYDLEKMNETCLNAINDAKTISPQEFKSYVRYEDVEKTPRTLITLSPYDRVVTSYLIFELASIINWRFDSFSYNINLLTSGDIFFPWFHSWKKFNEAIYMYLNTGFFDDLNVIKLDIRKFYDNIYFHSIYDEIIRELTKSSLNHDDIHINKAENIFRVLCKYNDQIMLQLTENVKGVPQGPAYARVMAEIFIASIIKQFKSEKDGIIILRYVDDMFILHDASRCSADLINNFSALLLSKGLELNDEKTKIYGQISLMSLEEKNEICESNGNYSIKTIKSLELESLENRDAKIDIFKRFIDDNGDWKKDANFILNDYIEGEFIEIYLKKYYTDLVRSKVGRGSVFKKFYQYIMNDSMWLKKFLKERLYIKIPDQTLNLKCFLNVLFDKILNNDLFEYSEEVNCLIESILNRENLDIHEKNMVVVINKKWKDKLYELR